MLGATWTGTGGKTVLLGSSGRPGQHKGAGPRDLGHPATEQLRPQASSPTDVLLSASAQMALTGSSPSALAAGRTRGCPAGGNTMVESSGGLWVGWGCYTDLPLISVTVQGDSNIPWAVEVLGSLSRDHRNFQLGKEEKGEGRGAVTEQQAQGTFQEAEGLPETALPPQLLLIQLLSVAWSSGSPRCAQGC